MGISLRPELMQPPRKRTRLEELAGATSPSAPVEVPPPVQPASRFPVPSAGGDPFAEHIARLKGEQPKGQGMSKLEQLASGMDVEGEDETTRPQAGLAGLAQGMTFGFADELTAVIEAIATGKPYKEALENRRRLYGEAREEHPGTMFAGEIAGGIAVPLGAASGAKTLGQAAKAGAKAGGAGGAIAGVGASEGDPTTMEGLLSRTAGGVAGGALGTVAGGALPVIAAPLRAAGRAAADMTGVRLPARAPKGDIEYRYTGPATTDDIRGALRTTEERADDKLLAAIEKGGFTRERLAQEAAGLGDKPETVLEIAGQPAQRLARASRSASSATSKELDDFMQQRAAGAEERILDDLLQTTGQPGRTNTVTEFDALVEARKAHAKPLYEKAYQTTIQSNAVKEALDLPAFQQAYEAGRRIAQVERRSLPTIEQGVKDGFPVEAIDYMKRGLDSVIESGAESGRSMSRTEARVLRNRLAEVLDEVDQAVPDYAKARKQFAGDSELIEGLEAGRSLFKMHPDEAKKTLDGLSEAGRERYRQGAFEALADRIESIAPGNDVSRRVAEKTLDKKRLRLLFPDEESFGRFQDLIKREASMNASRNFLRGNSQTVDKLVELADLAGVSVDAVFSGPEGMFRALARRGMDRARHGMTERTSEALSKRFTAETGTPAFSELLDAMAQAEMRRTGQAGRAVRAGGAVGRSAGSSTQRRDRP